MTDTPATPCILSKRLLIACAMFFLAGFLRANVEVFTDGPFGAVGDGTADNRAALTNALAQLKSGDTLWVPPGDYAVILTKDAIRVPEGVTLLGQSGRSKIRLLCSGAAAHREFLRLASHVTLEGLTIERGGDFPMVIFPIFGDLRDIALRNCTVIGNTTGFPGTYCHAVQVGVGKVSDLALFGTEIRNCSYGLFQANSATGSLDAMTVDRCLFVRNSASDLEFNSPKGIMRHITVRNCLFRDNLCRSPGAGFAVGFANVAESTVENCHILNYGSEALHVEDRSSDIRLSGNTIMGGSLLQNNGVIMVLSASTHVTVAGNIIDARSNTNSTHLVLVTAGGKRFANPSHVSLVSNVLVHGCATRTWYLQPGSGPAPIGNVVTPTSDTPVEEQHAMTPIVFTHMADASAGEWLGENLFVAANDEDNVLRVYRLPEGGAPVATWDASPWMALDKKSPEMDIEGSAKIGDILYWITSHAPNREGKPRPNRKRFFATRVALTNGAPAFKLIGKPVMTLLADLDHDSRYAAFGLATAALRAPKTPGSLNIEALCDTPDSSLLIGFRSPNPEGCALLVPLTNPAETVTGKPPVFGDPVLLDLNGHGVRAMIRTGDSYLLISGSPLGGGTQRFYRWDGHGKPHPQPLADLPTDANPEGLVPFDRKGQLTLLVLSDDGTRLIGGLPAKAQSDPLLRTFRGFCFPLAP